jgi:hypothetical protein
MTQVDTCANNTPAVRPRRSRRGETNRRPRGDAEYKYPRARVDRRTRAGRRVAALVADITAALGGEIDGVTRAQVERIAELTVAAELMRGAVLKGAGRLEVEVLTKLESEARRAWRELGQPIAALRPEKPSPGLALLEQRFERRQAAGKAQANQGEPAA